MHCVDTAVCKVYHVHRSPVPVKYVGWGRESIHDAEPVFVNFYLGRRADDQVLDVRDEKPSPPQGPLVPGV